MKTIISVFITLLFFSSLKAQNNSALDTVIVEKYYISDNTDAKDIQYVYNSSDSIIDSLKLEPGSVTYRVYIQMKPGCKLTKLYGDSIHVLKISSTTNFYNNVDFGKSFGWEINNSKVIKMTTGLDTWLTLGMVTSTNLGLLKKEDSDGSILGKNGYLTNADTSAGIPLTTADGFDSTKVSIPAGWGESGIRTGSSDSTIFGSLKFGNEFKSNDAYIKNNGVFGPGPGNKVLIAQLTTYGVIKFELNIGIVDTLNPLTTIYFVAKPNKDVDNKYVFARACLIYPPPPIPCGCKDPAYKEFNPYYTCSNPDSCKTLKPHVKFGCKDPMACNYDSSVTFHVPELCCFPGLCGGRDISIVCPELGKQLTTLKMYPNPVQDKLSLEISNMNSEKYLVSIYDVYGRKIYENQMSTNSNIQEIDVSKFIKGAYLLRVQNYKGVNIKKHLIKN
jgi:hypothetical protein